MIFSSITFLYYFLPITIVLYFLTPQRHRNVTLLLVSLFFYGWSEPRIVFYMLLTITVNYVLGLLIEQKPQQKKLWLTMSVVFCLGSLGYFKYADFFIESFNQATGLSLKLLNVALPVGISFYTFQVLSYVIDVYRGDVMPQKSWLRLATYISMFPQLIAGPIVRYHDVALQLESRSYSVDGIAEGGRRFVYGLAKKVLLANVLGELCADFRMVQENSVAFCWLYAAAFTLQIYYDFSGYSDMAIGLGRILGFDFMENFRYPLTAKSITEFWRRWHISLGSWFRDYVYIPLGGSRVKPFRAYCNILIVWMLTGLWHGAAWNFVLWGLYFALLLLIEKRFLLACLADKAVFSHIYVIFAVTISFVLFNGETLSQAVGDLAGMFGLAGLPLMTEETLYYLSGYGLILMAALIGATPAVAMAAQKLKGRAGWAEPLLLVCLLILITACLVDGSFNPFLYFRF